MADLVLRCDDQRFTKIAGLDGASTLQQPAHRARQSGADDDREDQAQRRGEHRQEDGDKQNDALLSRGRSRIRLQKADHFVANGIELMVELVAQYVHSLEAVGNRLLVAGVEKGQQACDLIVEVAARIIDQVGEMIAKLDQLGGVAEAAALLDQAVDQPACGFKLRVDGFAFGAEIVGGGGQLRGIDRRPVFLDHHAAERHRARQRMDVGPRQSGVSWNITLRQVLEPGADLHHQGHREQRRDRHQDDEDQRDRDDLALDRQSDHRAILVAAELGKSAVLFLEEGRGGTNTNSANGPEDRGDPDVNTCCLKCLRDVSVTRPAVLQRAAWRNSRG